MQHCEICGTDMVRKPRRNGYYCPLNREGWHRSRASIRKEQRRIEQLEQLLGLTTKEDQ